MSRPSKIDSRCVDLRTSMVDVKILILYIAVCELRRGFALQCFHSTIKCDRPRGKDHKSPPKIFLRISH